MSRRQYLYRWIMWNIFSRLFVTIYLQPSYRFHRTADSDRFPKPPFMLVANHGTFFDPWIIGTYSPYPFALMCNDDAFRGGAISRWYLRSIGAFPKKKGASDFRATKTTMNLLAHGYPVCIFPEGQTTWDGETQLLYRGIERIVKRCGCALVSVRIRGNFLTKPWWADSKRRGRIALTIRVLPAERVQTLTTDELFDYVKESIQQNDVTDPANLAVPFSGRCLACGAERLLWLCPHCRSEDRIVCCDNTISCTDCNRSWTLDPWCRTRANQSDTAAPPHLHAWSRLQREQVIQKINTCVDKGAPLTENDFVVLQTQQNDGSFVEQGRGLLRLTPSTLSFFFRDHSQTTLTMPLSAVSNYVIQRKDIFECTCEGRDFRFVLPHKSPLKWVYYLRYLKGYQRFEAQGWIE